MITNKFKMQYLYTFFLFFILYGFYPFTSFFEKLGIINSVPSYIYRTIVLLLTFILIINVKVTKKNDVISIIALISWFCFLLIYSFRLFYDVTWQADSLSKPISFYLIFFYLTCIIPSLSGITLQKYSDFRLLVKVTYIVSAFFFLLIIFNFFSSVLSIDKLSLRLHTDKANPIAISHYAGSVFIISALVYVSKEKFVSRNVTIIFVLLSFFIMLLTGSRGPLLATVISFVLYLIFSNRLNLRVLLVFLLVCIVGYFSDLFYVNYFSAESVFTRFLSTAGVNDQASHLRLISFWGGIEQFVNSPYLGDLIEVRVTNYYPHNILIEAFMSTGVIGGMCFLIYFISCILISIRLMKCDVLSALFSIWFIKYFIGAQFSSSIYTMNELWILSIIILFRYKFIKFGNYNDTIFTASYSKI